MSSKSGQDEDSPSAAAATVKDWLTGPSPHRRADDDRMWGALDDLTLRVQRDPELWWGAIEGALEALEPEQSTAMKMGPMAALIRAGGRVWVERLATAAMSDPRLASVLADTLDFLARAFLDWQEGPNANVIFGRDFVAATLIHHYARSAGTADWDFWAWVTLDGLVRNDPDEAWELILRVIDLAPDGPALGNIGAGALEDLAKSSSKYAELAQARAAIDPKFAQALDAARLP